ncbi:hypothetical protein AYL99_11699 [Fonsecaea erecta]|uniref:F-box domain-containing protein n=1 Tax=Fonsecaea erecta TaxID=1367422 RepID=A0A178Z395_9EURO|nr:hypothetical protein AYL99_11699 [Fonsecaea erecta]OAP54164.1 hypothetical protein AYL99_11699 [Fonsecaea erecta]
MQWKTETTDHFRFLDLPQEIQDKVYEHVYEEKRSVQVSMHTYTVTNWSHFRPSNRAELVVRGYPYDDDSLARVSKKLRADSRTAHQQSFNGEMKIYWDHEWASTPFNLICGPRWALLRNRVLKLVICNLSGRNVRNDFPAIWRWIPTYFPRVIKIKVHYDAWRLWTVPTRLIFHEAFIGQFHSGEMDQDFVDSSEALGLHVLASAMEETPHLCTISLTTALHWHSPDQRHELSLYTKFYITTQGVSEPVSRLWLPHP